MNFPLFPPQASTTARQVDLLYFGLLTICGLVLAGLLVVMLWFIMKYRAGKPASRAALPLRTTPLEVSWTIIPFLCFMGLFTWGAVVYTNQQTIPPGGIEINVVGKQWMWKLQHANGAREINELHVPAGQVVKLILASQDVIHSFYIPAFRIKQDVVPGRYTTEWFKATKPGTYHIFCAEYCGKDHSRMGGSVIVMPPADYEAWLARGSQEPLARAGENVFRSLGCSGCHGGSPVVRAPPLEGLYGRPVPLQSGKVGFADEAYLRDSILQPERDVAAGYQPLMPSFRGRISEEDLFLVIAYLKSIGAEAQKGLNEGGIR